LIPPQLDGLGVDPAVVTPRLRRFAELLLDWNRGFSNLISRNDEARIVERHLLESLAPAKWIRDSGRRRWLDFGSGGGFPAIPLALAGIGDDWTLVESRRNKTLFLRKVIQELRLKDVEVVTARLESLAEEPGITGGFDGFTSRATLRLGPTLRLAAEWVAPGGVAFLWKGGRVELEMAEDRGWEGSWDPDGLHSVGAGLTVVARFVKKTD
jgi:16S rRNA (guanine527-N7)-methyltransferase